MQDEKLRFVAIIVQDVEEVDVMGGVILRGEYFGEIALL